ncbi:DUF4231 domain-containing protein [Nocardia sp. NPDC057663]
MRWYREHTRSAQRMYRRVKFGQLVIAAVVPVLADATRPVTECRSAG